MKSCEESLLHLRHLFPYYFVKEKFKAGSRVLDLGCNEGYGTQVLSGKFDVVGLDITKELIARAISTYGCKFKCYDGRKIPFDDCSFDVVVSFQVIEHIADVDNFLGEIFRVLKPGGFFYCTTPCRVYRLLPGQKPWNTEHLREYLPEEFYEVLAKYFKVTMRGIRGTDELERIEFNRVKPFLLVGKDKFNLRRFVPRFVKKAIMRFMNAKGSKDFKEYSVKDFYVFDGDLYKSLDLFGECLKL